MRFTVLDYWSWCVNDWILRQGLGRRGLGGREGVVGGMEAGRHGVRAGGVESWGRGRHGRGWGRQGGGAEVCLVGEGGEDSRAGLGVYLPGSRLDLA